MTSLQEALNRVMGAKPALDKLLDEHKTTGMLPDKVVNILQRNTFWAVAEALHDVLEPFAQAIMAIQVSLTATIMHRVPTF